jgi:hypothetical protein
MPGFRQPGGQREVVALTASTTLTSYDSGKIFTNRGATGSITITLPVVNNETAGAELEVLVIADQTVIVASSPADTLVIFNDAAADSIALQTSGEKIGGALRFVCDGTAWVAQSLCSGAHTLTTATA